MTTGKAFQYHERTSYARNQVPPHYLDWDNQPTVFKEYPGVDPIQLTRDIRHPAKPLSSVLKPPSDPEPRSLTVEELSRILLLTNSLTARAKHPGGDFYYRSAASAGALYPTEIYVAASGVAGLASGLYHFSLAHHGLALLRGGDLHTAVAGATGFTGNHPPTLTFFLSAIYFRSSWKYRDRAYRYHLMDAGHVGENLLLALNCVELPFFWTCDFEDPRVNALLGLNEEKEACLAVCHVPGVGLSWNTSEDEPDELPQLYASASQVAAREVDYPAIREVHTAGIPLAATGSQSTRVPCDLGPTPVSRGRFQPPDPPLPSHGYPEALFRRRSRRNFLPQALSQEQLTTLLDAVSVNVTESDHDFVCAGLLLRSAQGWEPGFYLVEARQRATAMVSRDPTTRQMTRVCLGQEWLSQAAAHFLFMVNLEQLETLWGARGYRYAMITAGRLGERLYLAATDLGLGCCGIGAFYDGEAGALLGLNSASRLIYLVAAGPVKKV